MGWKRDNNNNFNIIGGDDEEYVEITFEFNTLRRFSRVDLYTNNYPSKGVQVRCFPILFMSKCSSYYCERFNEEVGDREREE